MATDSFSLYSEDEIVSKLTQTFDIYIDLCYIPRNDVVFPSTTGINTTLPRQRFSSSVKQLFSHATLTPELVSLLERIPYICEEPSDTYNVYPNDIQFYCFTDEDYFKSARDSFDGLGDEAVLLESSEFALTIPSSRDGGMFILDVAENSVRRFDWMNPPALQSSFPVPDNKSHYKNYPPTSAPVFLQEWIDDLRNLKFIPYVNASGYRSFMYAPSQPEDAGDDEEEVRDMYEARLREPTKGDRQYFKLKDILEQTYGWPDAFQKEKWARDCERIWNAVEEGYVPPQEVSEL